MLSCTFILIYHDFDIKNDIQRVFHVMEFNRVVILFMFRFSEQLLIKHSESKGTK